MRVLRLEATGLRGLRDGAFTFEPDRGGAGHTTVVTGPPQAGLTTLLDAVALTAARLAATGTMPDPADALRPLGSTAMIRTTWWLDADERAYGGVREETTDAEVVFQRGGLGRGTADPVLLGLFTRYDHKANTPKVLAIPARRVADGSFPMLGDFETDQRYKHLSSDPGKFAGLSHALIRHATGLGERARFEAVQRIFDELAGSVRLEGVGADGHLEFALGSGMRVPLHRLSFGERNAFVLAATPVLLGLSRGVILLDTPELGLAPGVAARWMEALRAGTPGAQWIVASRDPAVVQSVEPAARITLAREAS